MVKPEHFYDGSMKSGQLWRNKICQWVCAKLRETLQGLLTQILLSISLSSEIRVLFPPRMGRAPLTWSFYDLSQGQMIRKTFLFLPVSQTASVSKLPCFGRVRTCPEPHHILSTFCFYPFSTWRIWGFLELKDLETIRELALSEAKTVGQHKLIQDRAPATFNGSSIHIFCILIHLCTSPQLAQW